MSSYPFEGRLHRAAVKAFEPTIVFIHNFGGTHATTRRYQEMVGTMGFDSFSFTLGLCSIPLSARQKREALRVGMIEHWTKELEIVLEALDGPKIMYTFSFPSVTVPALLYRSQRRDVLGWVCDGGPFLNLWQNLWNFYSYQSPVPSRALRAWKTESAYFVFGGHWYRQRLRRWVPALDPQFPILSVREGSDQLVSQETIDAFFAFNPGLNLRRLVIPQAGHLDGLKKSPELYRDGVGGFLKGLCEK
jgi:pimeloyl-ACP methyl ester carboxylesterase